MTLFARVMEIPLSASAGGRLGSAGMSVSSSSFLSWRPCRVLENKTPCRGKAYTVFQVRNETGPCKDPSCPNRQKRVYYPCGVDTVHCVGGTAPAQTRGSCRSPVLPLFYFLMTLYSIRLRISSDILHKYVQPYMSICNNGLCHTI